MPRGDRTGPAGFGPMTGRRAGFCAGFAVPGYTNTIAGYGMGYDRGTRRMRWVPNVPNWGYGYTDDKPMDEKEALSNHANMLEKELMQIKQRLKALEED